MRAALYSTISDKLIKLMRDIEPDRFPESMSDEEFKSIINIDESISRLVQHHYDITNIFGAMYEDVANKITEVKMNLSFFRSQPNFQQLEKVMYYYYYYYYYYYFIFTILLLN